MLRKSETNNAIITKLCNIRPHPNADRLKLATVLGTQVIVGLDALEGDLIIYFDSNLKLSHEYLYLNNLYSDKELNSNPEVKGYFGKSGRVRAQRFRGEISNGYVAELESLNFSNFTAFNDIDRFKEGDEFTHINRVEICSKYTVPIKGCSSRNKRKKKLFRVVSDMFHKHWDTKQLMRESNRIAPGVIYIEEKIHGTSGRTANVLCSTGKKWWQFWKPAEEWRIISGTHRVDKIDFHIPEVRKQIENKVVPHLHKGEEIYYEVYGYDSKGGVIQTGYPYNCKPGEYKVLLYRVTITTLDGFCIDLNREQVYRRAEELGLEKPVLLHKRAVGVVSDFEHELADSMQEEYVDDPEWEWMARTHAQGKSTLDANTLREGIVVWFKDKNGDWNCLKHKSEEFLVDQDKRYEKEQGDVEDLL